ncbi:hypothetical protein ASE00_13610 [Sphingomonas sp. Root710]|uniref:acyl-CoA dehydrogenase family protein n=1 Tax=Sphingomonas sp. Root710 TaxID=1736594 RepID=UPI0006F1DEE7|nr:acyl-CoA dehydrogenase family protein [Sphingomonas sp. Root710]KRB83019.1 hypothetical protein ASE00_13610 [Sphingomonas sp. Root710]
MHFDLSPEHYQFQENIDRLLSDSVDLAAMTRGEDVIGPLRDTLDAAFADMGVGMVLAPEETGGLQMGLLTLTCLADSLGRHAAPTSALNGAVAAWLVASSGDDRLIKQWLEPLLGGTTSVTFACNEAPGMWTPETSRSTSGDDIVTRHNVPDADTARLIIAPLADGLVFVDHAALQDCHATPDPLDMTRPTGTVSFAPSKGIFIGPELTGPLYDALLILTAADAAGAGRRAFELTVDYAKTREQFGQPIGAFQGVKHQIADMAVDIEPAKFLCWRAAQAWDAGAADASRYAALCKAHAADVAVKTARAAVEVHGGIGYTWEYPLHLLLKRAMHDRITLGSPTLLRQRVAEYDALRTASS